MYDPSEAISSGYGRVQGPVERAKVQGRVLGSVVSWSVRQGNGSRILCVRQRQHCRQMDGGEPLGLPMPTGHICGYETHPRPL